MLARDHLDLQVSSPSFCTQSTGPKRAIGKGTPRRDLQPKRGVRSNLALRKADGQRGIWGNHYQTTSERITYAVVFRPDHSGRSLARARMHPIGHDRRASGVVTARTGSANLLRVPTYGMYKRYSTASTKKDGTATDRTPPFSDVRPPIAAPSHRPHPRVGKGQWQCNAQRGHAPADRARLGSLNRRRPSRTSGTLARS
jgi:hypothetical protein